MPAIIHKLAERSSTIIAIVLLVGLWQAACSLWQVPNFLLPSPHAIVLKIAEMPERISLHLLVTLKEIVLGFAFAVVGGVLLAIAIVQSKVLAKLLLPLLISSQAVPTIATAPILVIWFGPSETARMMVVFIIAFFPMVVNTIAGLTSVSPEYLDLVNGLKSSRFKRFTKIEFPNALPNIFMGMRISIVLSVIGAVVAEFVASTQGLGFLIFTGAANLETSLMFAAVVLLAVVGNILYHGVGLLQWLVIPWAPASQSRI